MIPKLLAVRPMTGYRLLLEYQEIGTRIFSCEPILGYGKFTELRDEEIFRKVKVSFDAVEWSNGLDLDPELLFEKSIAVKEGDDIK